MWFLRCVLSIMCVFAAIHVGFKMFSVNDVCFCCYVKTLVNTLVNTLANTLVTTLVNTRVINEHSCEYSHEYSSEYSD